MGVRGQFHREWGRPASRYDKGLAGPWLGQPGIREEGAPGLAPGHHQGRPHQAWPRCASAPGPARGWCSPATDPSPVGRRRSIRREGFSVMASWEAMWRLRSRIRDGGEGGHASRAHFGGRNSHWRSAPPRLLHQAQGARSGRGSARPARPGGLAPGSRLAQRRKEASSNRHTSEADFGHRVFLMQRVNQRRRRIQPLAWSIRTRLLP